VGISSYPPEQTEAAAQTLSQLGTPLLVHQPPYSMFNRWIESGLLDTFGRLEIGCIVFSPLAQGLLTDRYLESVPPGSRASQPGTLDRSQLGDDALAKVRALQEIARRRGQTMAQLALAWTLRDPRVTSTLIGASSVAQLEQNVATIERLGFSSDELEEIEKILRSG
jgi:L-glyceraldehyde 3-phosphate reductase